MLLGVAIELRFRSRLRAPAADVWAVVSTMDGVNAELRPWIRMTHPPRWRSLDQPGDLPEGTIFRSWLLAGGVLPIDRHSLGLERVLPGEGFDEESSSWLQRRWRHERRVLDDGASGSSVTDRLVIEPRLRITAPMVRLVVAALFRHRHRRLRRRFGARR